MRIPLLAATLLLSACGPGDVRTAGLTAGNYSGEGRDRLCVTGEGAAQRAGFIAYGTGDSNCSATGRVEAQGDSFALIPAGEGACRIGLSVADGRIILGPADPACNYYCGPGARFDGRAFGPDPAVSATDLAGDKLC